MTKLLLPQEIETFYVIPTLRKQLAVAMKESGMKQKEIAAIFGVNTAAISQYTKNKRGSTIVFDHNVIAKIKESAIKITNTFSYLQQTQYLLKFIRETKALCQIHKLISTVPENCEPQEIGCHSGGTCT